MKRKLCLSAACAVLFILLFSAAVFADWNTKAEETMGFPRAWELFEEQFADTVPEAPVSIGVIDTMFSTSTQDLHYGGLLYSYTEEALQNYMAQAKQEMNLDHYSEAIHGTHVAGILGADRSNGVGIDGAYPLAYDRSGGGAGISRLFLLCSHGSYTVTDEPRDGLAMTKSTQLDILLRNGVKVINWSMGYVKDSLYDDKLHETDADEVGRYLQEQLDAGKDFVICCSAGNEGSLLKGHPDAKLTSWLANISRELYPDVCDRIIVVGNCNARGKLDMSSSAGERMDLMAVGKNIESLVPGGGLYIMAGTSQATPYVSAAAAMVWTAAPHLTGAQVKEIIVSTAAAGSGEKGVLNAGMAVEKALACRDEALERQAAENALPEELFALKPSETEEEALKRYCREVLVKNFGQVSPGRVTGGYDQEEPSEGVFSDRETAEAACSMLSGVAGYHIGVIDVNGREDSPKSMAVLRTKASEDDGAIRLECWLELYQAHDGRVALMDRLQLESAIHIRLEEYPNIQIGLFQKNTKENRFLIWGIEAAGKGSVYRFGVVTWENGCLYQQGYFGFGLWADPEGMALQKETMDRETIQSVALYSVGLYVPKTGKTVGNDSLVQRTEVNEDGAEVTVNAFRNCFHTQFASNEDPARYLTPIAQLCVNISDDTERGEHWMDIDLAATEELLSRAETEKRQQ